MASTTSSPTKATAPRGDLHFYSPLRMCSQDRPLGLHFYDQL